ncbi:MAG TPA: ABC transporter substrate-binding protein, partial [Polyangiaceae bacterium]|nr:ABC transporter substrate-binding protein [Polyangiaceae bacterium]
QRGSVEVAVAAPLDELGTMDDARRAWQLVASEINDAGGINGRTLRVHERDTPLTDPNDTAPIADGFVDLSEQGYRYIISLVSGAALEPVMRAATTYDVLALSITSEDSATALPSTDGLLLRGVLPTDRVIDKQATALQAAGLINILSIGPTRSGVPDARLSAMSAAYAGCTACSATELTYPAEADLYSYDWQSFGARAMTRPALAQPPQVVYLAIADAQVLLDVVRSLDVAGYTGLYYFAYAGYLPWVIPAFKPSLYQRFRSYDLALPPSPELDQFSALYSERYGDSFVPEPRLLAFTDYLALLALAMDQVGDTDPGLVAAKVKQIASPPGTAYGPLEYRAAQSALRAGQDINYQGLSGALDFDANGEVSDGFIQEYGVNTDGDVVALP